MLMACNLTALLVIACHGADVDAPLRDRIDQSAANNQRVTAVLRRCVCELELVAIRQFHLQGRVHLVIDLADDERCCLCRRWPPD